jgi:hypothetical protein
VKVDAFRNRARGNPLPMFFGHVVGLGDQGVRATATAEIIPGKLNECLKPWAVMDRWDEFDGTETEYNLPGGDPDYNYYNSTFDKYSDGGGNRPPQEDDLYVPPSKINDTAGTGFSLPNDFGKQYIVKMDDNTNSTVSPGWFRAIRIPRLDGQNGGSVYKDNIVSCGGLPTGYAKPETVCPEDIGNDDMAYWAERGCYATEPGNMVGPTRQGVDEILAKDKSATWNSTLNKVENSAFAEAMSPRIVPIGVIDINHFLSQDPSGANGVLRMVNIFGFFLEGYGDVEKDGSITMKANGKAIVGRIMTLPALDGSNTLPNTSAFLKKVILVR